MQLVLRSERFSDLVYDLCRSRLSRAESVVAQVHGQRARAACRVRERARKPAERADAAHEVAVLKRGGTLRHDVVAVQARSDAAADDGAVHRTHERHGESLQRSEAREEAPQSGSSSGKRCVALVSIVVAARREVRAGAANHYRTYPSATRGQLLGSQQEIPPHLV